MKTFAGAPYRLTDTGHNHEFYVIRVDKHLVARVLELQKHVQDANAFCIETFYPGALAVYSGGVKVPKTTVFPDDDQDQWKPGDFENVQQLVTADQCLVVTDVQFLFSWLPRGRDEKSKCESHVVYIEDIA